jgi:L-ascorbate metabolism protein UlaG (beta-lactamase superfamily)
MGPDDAVEAVALLKPKQVIPMHYNTWPVIAQDPEAFKQKVENRLQIPVRIMNPGEAISIP